MRVIGRGRACLLFAAVVAAIVLAGCGGATSSGSNTAASGGGGSSSADAALCGGSTSVKSASLKSIPGVPTTNAGMTAYGQKSPGNCEYVGPGGYSINMKACPSNYNINLGITKNSIQLFTSAPHSGALAAYGAIEDGAKSYFQYINQHGGINGRKIDYTIMDDQYEPNLTAQNVNSAIQSNKYASSFAVFGTPNALGVRGIMNKACMGEYMVGASDDEFSDPQQYPWTTGFGIDRYNETDIMAKFLESKYPQGAKVVYVTMSGGLGESYQQGFQKAFTGSNMTDAGAETFSDTAPSITNQITSAQATGAKIAILNVAGTYCTQAIADIEKSSWHPTIMVPNTCAQISTAFAPLLAEGATGNGVYTNRYYYAPTDPDAPTTGPAASYISLYNKTLKSQGLDPSNAQYANGWWWGWDFVQVLEDAAVMKGGLNRATINIAAHSYTSKWPLLMPGVVGHADGLSNAFPYQEDRIYQYVGATAKKTGKFVPAGPLVNNTGKLHNYLYASKLTGG